MDKSGCGSFVRVSSGEEKRGHKSLYKPSHQACRDMPTQPNYVFVQRTTALPSVWSGSETFADFELPQSLGVVDQLIVRFQLSLSFTGGTTPSLTLPPTPFWCSRVEEYIGNDLLATTYANEQYNEGVGFLDATALEQMGAAMNLSQTSNFIDYGNGIIPSGTSFYYLPLVASAFNTMNPCVAGFNAKLRVRLYFPSSIIAATNGSPTTTSFALTDCLLIARELKTKNTDAFVRAHHNGVVDYNVIVRERQVDQTTLTQGITTPFYLRSFKNDSAGLITYITDQSPSNADLSKRFPIQDIQLLDNVNNKLTEVTRRDFNAPFIWNDAVQSAFTTAQTQNHVLITPFSADFRKTASTGCDFGKFPLSTLEKLQLTPDSSSANNYGSKAVYNISYSYGHVVVTQGKHLIQMTSTSGR
jgi:hypothetical protein